MEKSPAYPADREHQKVLENFRFGAGTPVGLRPPYVPAPKRSHPVCHASLILIVALHRPTSRKKSPIPRGRRRPDPLAKVTDDLKAWFNGDPSQTGRELLGRLQAAHPDDYPDALIRTVQRRVKIWRGDIARSFVFGPDGDAQPQMTSDALRNLEAAHVRGHLQPAEPETDKGGHSKEQMAEATT